MAELTLNPADVTAALRKNLAGWEPSVEAETIGYVTSIGDGVARVSGLPGAMASELLEFPGGLTGVALNLDEDSIGAVLMGDSSHVEEGDEVRSTGRVLSIPVGDALLGRVVDPLGNPIDGKGPINTTETRLLETQAPSVVERQPVSEPLQTGIKGIDVGDGSVTARREIDGGFEVYEVPTPAVLGVKEGINLPRYPTMKGRLASKKAALATVEQPTEAGGQERLRLHRPVEQVSETVILGEGPEAAAAVVDVLEELGVLA